MWSQRMLAVLAMATIVAPLKAQAPGPPRTAEQAYKNIQVLKTIPADQLIPSMQFIAASLGVECEFCHVAGAFEKDDKKPKQTARKMMEMMFTIDKTNFEGKQEVTCYSCHRGNVKPVPIPVIPEGNVVEQLRPMGAEAREEEKQKAEAKIPVDPILEKYIAAVGGAEALKKIKSRVEKGSADVSGRKFPIEVYAEGPDKRATVMHLPNGDSVTAYNGSAGWLSFPGRPTHWMSQPEAEAARLDAEFYLPLRMKEIFSEFRVAGTEKVDGKDVTLVLGLRSGKPEVKFYFDPESGLLVRMVRYAATPLGLNPSEIDYADYRETGGVKIPYRWTIARPSGRFTIQVEQVQHNVAIEAAKFVPPAK
jgi:photosynthetic reaction center cytochrome c subunit